MQLRYIPLLSLVLASTYVYAAPLDFAGASATFAIDHKTEVPGLTLKPGEYTIRIVDQLSDRMIVRIDSSTSKDHAIFLGVPSSSIAASSGSGAVNWSSPLSGSEALRGFSFAKDKTVEFVYPKTEAVALAKSNAARVVAIDPESQNLPVLKNLSRDDMQIINLWVLSLTTAGADGKAPAILAQKFQGDDSAGKTVVASAPAAAPPAPQPTQVASIESPRGAIPNSDPTLAAKPARPVIARLPKTASPMPLIWILGLLSLLSAFGIRVLRHTMDTTA